MRALTVTPRTAGTLRLENIPEPRPKSGEVLVRTHAIGICGTDLEIAQGLYGAAPAGEARLVLGHESIGRVAGPEGGADLPAGTWVVGIVRHPDPVPCTSCAAGEWDMCRNGGFTEHGIAGLDGFGRDLYAASPAFLVPVAPALGELGVLLEPTSVVAKAWEHALRIGARATFHPRRVLVTGAGPIGLLAAMLGVQRQLEVHVLDRVTEGTKPALVRELGATYHSGAVAEAGADWDLVFECTGAPAVFFDAIRAAARDGIVCLTGVSSGGHLVGVDAGALNRELVLENNVVFGSVNANRRHYQQAADALARAERGWLERLLTRRLPIERYADGFARQPGDVKTILTFD